MEWLSPPGLPGLTVWQVNVLSFTALLKSSLLCEAVPLAASSHLDKEHPILTPFLGTHVSVDWPVKAAIFPYKNQVLSFADC